jgi:VIT1/CCC1 family predicted Fe2+/Mn2+ transporter
MTMQENWWEEKRSSYLYGIMAESETHPLRKKLFLDLAKAADDQAQIWVEKARQSGQSISIQFQPNFRTRLVAKLVNIFGVEKLRYILSSMKVRGMSVFTKTQHEYLHRGVTTAGNLRAAVFGINDGLISNVSLIIGISAANANHQFVVLAGIAGLLAGACSMAAGEYVSVRSQREVFEYQIELERSELEMYPEEEMEELALIYQARGIPKDQSIQLAELLINNPNTALDTLAREELGLNPDELGSPIGAMLSSFISFSIGAAIPIIPFLIKVNGNSLVISIIISAISLFMIGSVLSLYTNKNAFKGGLRMLLIGVAAGIITHLIGHLIGGGIGVIG